MSNIIDYNTKKAVQNILSSIDFLDLISKIREHNLSLNLLCQDISIHSKWSDCIYDLPHDVNKIINLLCKYIYIHNNKIIKFSMIPINNYDDSDIMDIIIYVPYGIELEKLHNKYLHVTH